MYLRVKRHKTCWFVEANEQDTVALLKKHICEYLVGKTVKDIQLQIPGKTAGSFIALEDENKLDQLGILDDSVLYLSLMTEGFFFLVSYLLANQWEPIEVPEYSPLEMETKE